MVLTGITYGIKPYGASNMGWANPFVIGMIAGGLALLVAFVFIELRVADPMFHLALFRIRAFAAGNLAVVLSSTANGGMQFMLIMWLQGIWLPLHGYSFEQTPLWAGIYMLPLTLGFLVAGPVSGILSDRYGARPFATAGMLLAALSFLLLMALPANFAYWAFACVLFLNGIAFGMFAAPNTAAIMNSVPARNRGVASGMRATCQMLGQPLSIGIFFSLMVVGLTANVPGAMFAGLTAQHVPAPGRDAALAHAADRLPVRRLPGLQPAEGSCSARTCWARCPLPTRTRSWARSSSPRSSPRPFKDGIVDVLVFAAAMCLVAALASWLRGGKFVHDEAHAAHGHGLSRARVTDSSEDRKRRDHAALSPAGLDPPGDLLRPHLPAQAQTASLVRGSYGRDTLPGR